MNKTFFSTLILLALLLSACGTSKSTTPGAQNTAVNSELPQVITLVLGTLQLKNTENAVMPEQAQKLLPLWQVYLSLLSSDIAAQEEIDALVEQIGETMTPEQTQAIETMQLTQEDMFTVMQTNGLGMGGNRPEVGNDTNSSGNNSGGFTPPDGGGSPPDGGGMPGVGGMPGGGIPSGTQNQSGDQSTAAQPAQVIGGGGVPTPLLQAVIDYLQEIASS